MTPKIILASAVLCLFACNSNKTEPAADTATDTTKPKAEAPAPAPEKHTYAVAASYSSDMAMGDPKLADIVVELWKQYDENTMAQGLNNFADTVEMWASDGWHFRGTRDSLVKSAKMERDGYKAFHTKIVAIAPLKAVDKDANWVCMWGTEYKTDKKNKVDSSDIQENWAFDKNGKVNFIHTYRRKLHK